MRNSTLSYRRRVVTYLVDGWETDWVKIGDWYYYKHSDHGIKPTISLTVYVLKERKWVMNTKARPSQLQ